MADDLPRTSAEDLTQYYSHVQNYVRTLVRSPHLAEDVVQQTYLRALRWLHTRDPPRHPCGWLIAIARNVVHDTMNEISAARIRDNSPEECIEDASEPLETLVAQEEVASLHRGIANLTQPDQELLLSFHYASKPFRLLAAENSISYPAVKTRMFRARRRLKRMLSHEPEAGGELRARDP